MPAGSANNISALQNRASGPVVEMACTMHAIWIFLLRKANLCAGRHAGLAMSTDDSGGFDPNGAIRPRRSASDRLRRVAIAIAAAALLASSGSFAQAASFRQGVSAFNRQDYASASQNFIPLAERGVPSAQSYLGFMFETGRGVPQNYTEAAMWYRRAAEQGDSLAQYSLGLLYDRGFGVPRDIVEAGKWLNLATAAAPRPAREARARIRDAVTTKMTRGEIARARRRALEWAPSRER
jgi:uncharacterized protein